MVDDAEVAASEFLVDLAVTLELFLIFVLRCLVGDVDPISNLR
jgi:hypothetical protein